MFLHQFKDNDSQFTIDVNYIQRICNTEICERREINSWLLKYKWQVALWLSQSDVY